VYVEVEVGVVDSVLEVPLAPVHPPLAVQEVALVELQVSVEELPCVIEDGEADKDRVGAIKDTVTDLLIDPPVTLSLQTKVYVLFVVGVTTSEAEVALLPNQPPLAVQEVASVDDQVRVEEEPALIDVGEAERVRVMGETITLVLAIAEPLSPVHFTT
jgi:hypothetical protein